MDDATRARLLRRADRIEHRLGIITDAGTGELRPATATEQQARAIRLGGTAHKYVAKVADHDDEREETTTERQVRELQARYVTTPEPRPSRHDRDDEYDDDAPHRMTASERQAQQIRRGH